MNRRRHIALAALAVAGLASAVLYVAYIRPLQELVDTGAGFLAKQMCSCIYVDERSAEACRPDMMAMMDPIDAEVLTNPPGVRTSVLLTTERVAAEARLIPPLRPIKVLLPASIHLHIRQVCAVF